MTKNSLRVAHVWMDEYKVLVVSYIANIIISLYSQNSNIYFIFTKK